MPFWKYVIAFTCLLPAHSVAVAQGGKTNIFQLPRKLEFVRQNLQRRQKALVAKKLDEAERYSQQAVDTLPGLPDTLLLLAATQAERGKTKLAFTNLSRAVDAGMNNTKALEKPVFAALKLLDGWDRSRRTREESQAGRDCDLATPRKTGCRRKWGRDRYRREYQVDSAW